VLSLQREAGHCFSLERLDPFNSREKSWSSQTRALSPTSKKKKSAVLRKEKERGRGDRADKGRRGRRSQQKVRRGKRIMIAEFPKKKDR